MNVLKISEKRIFNISHRNFYACIYSLSSISCETLKNLLSKMVLHHYFKVVGEDMVWCIFSEDNNIFWLSRTPLAPMKQTWGRKRVIVNLQILKFCVFLSFKHLQDFSDDVAKALPSTLHTHTRSHPSLTLLDGDISTNEASQHTGSCKNGSRITKRFSHLARAVKWKYTHILIVSLAWNVKFCTSMENR